MIVPNTPAGDEPLTRGEMLLIRRAFRNGWPVPAEARRRIGRRLSAVIDDGGRSARDKQKALETLAIVDRSGEPLTNGVNGRPLTNGVNGDD